MPLFPSLVRFCVDFLSARPQTSIYWLVPLTHGTVTPVASIRREGEGLHTFYADCRGGATSVQSTEVLVPYEDNQTRCHTGCSDHVLATLTSPASDIAPTRRLQRLSRRWSRSVAELFEIKFGVCMASDRCTLLHVSVCFRACLCYWLR